jgi:hypothetical protein
MARNAEGLTLEEVLCPTDSAYQFETRSGFEIATRNLSLFSFHEADDGYGSHGERQNISTKNRTLGLR